MSTLLLDDVGLCLLRQLSEALEGLRVMEDLGLAHSRTATISDLRDYWARTDRYRELYREFINHLRFAYSDRSYWPRLTISLAADVNISLEIAQADTEADLDYIAEKSVEAYRREEKK